MRVLREDISGLPCDERHWFALYTRPRHEFKVSDQLRQKDIEFYLPIQRVLKQWSDRRKWINEPLFRSYIFINSDAKERYRAVQATGALCVVHIHGQPIKVPHSEIERIQRVLKAVPEVEAVDYFSRGDPVEIIRGPLMGLRGLFLETAGAARLVIRLEAVQQGIRFSVSRSDVKAL
ncbi:UpxY family transcription antiterminator [bacterium]|nr:UpxY family transcription antiterminator [bacterium]